MLMHYIRIAKTPKRTTLNPVPNQPNTFAIQAHKHKRITSFNDTLDQGVQYLFPIGHLPAPPAALQPYPITAFHPLLFQCLSDFLISTQASAFFFHPPPLCLFLGFLDNNLIILTPVQITFRAFCTTSLTIGSEVLAEMSIPLSIPNILATDVAHLIATDTGELVAA